jgi:glutathione S-transferase
MTAIFVLHDLAPSPNNVKVRIALGVKGLPYERVPVDPQDRSDLVRISGQPLAPVLEHGDTVLFDSHAIIRYLDANVKQGPRLFAADRAAMKAIEKWEHASRNDLSAPIGMTFEQAFAEKPDAQVLAQASEKLQLATAGIEKRLGEGKWLVGDALTAADVFCATLAYYGMLPEQAFGGSPIVDFFRAGLKLGPGRERTREWCGRVMAFDA